MPGDTTHETSSRRRPIRSEADGKRRIREPYVRCCGRTAGATPPPTRFYRWRSDAAARSTSSRRRARSQPSGERPAGRQISGLATQRATATHRPSNLTGSQTQTQTRTTRRCSPTGDAVGGSQAWASPARVSRPRGATVSVCAAACAATDGACRSAGVAPRRTYGTRCESRRWPSRRATARRARGCARHDGAAPASYGGARDAPLSARRG
ncbi:hypothetical protein OKW30_003625 [Paraburkholderia sp. Clong3]